MKKAVVFALIIGLTSVVSTLHADCGKIGIGKRPPSIPLDPPKNDIPDIPKGGGGGADIPPVPPDGDDGLVPRGKDSDIIDGSLSLYKESRQQALVAWNGKEQMLFLTTNEQSVAGTRALISIMPLPGAPIAIKESERAVITRARNLVDKKIAEAGKTLDSGLALVFKTEIGVHKIFVWKIDSIDTLRNDINQFIAKTYGKEYSALISKEGYDIIKKYNESGFKYFAFDLVLADGKAEKTKVTIMYHYKSNFAFYPVAISQVGGTGVSTIALTMISPGGFNKVGVSMGGMDEAMLRNARKGGIEVDLSLNDLRSITPPLADFFANTGKAKGRIFEFTGNLDGSNKNNLPGLNKDVILWSE